MRRRLIVIAVVLLAAGGGFGWWWFNHGAAENGALVLYGNVDLREVSVAFNDNGRIAEVLVDEGDRVQQGQVLARLDTSRLTPQLDQAKAQMAAQQAVVDKLNNGSRPEEIAQARANVDAAAANATNARLNYERLMMLSSSSGGQATLTMSQIDAAKAAYDAAAAQQDVAQQSLALAEAGPRKEDIAQAAAQLDAGKAAVALIKQQIKDADLVAPESGVVRSRLLEPGEIASPQRPVFSLAIVDPKWVRAYVSEPDLPKVHLGADANVSIDGASGALPGRIGFISPVAEFTPRSIQTEELRTSLVYEVRIVVTDANDVLRLGMPATVTLTGQTATAGASE